MGFIALPFMAGEILISSALAIQLLSVWLKPNYFDFAPNLKVGAMKNPSSQHPIQASGNSLD